MHLNLCGVTWTPGTDLYDSMAGAAAAGCGGKTALTQFFKQATYMQSLEFSTDGAGQPSKLTSADASSETNMGLALIDVPSMLGGTVKSPMHEFDGKHLNIKMNLISNWKFEEEKLSEFIMYFFVKKNTEPSIW